jgi:hypothetical protein
MQPSLCHDRPEICLRLAFDASEDGPENMGTNEWQQQQHSDDVSFYKK